MLIRAIIIDDEQPAVDKMVNLLEESGVVEVKGAFTNSFAALKGIKNVPVDVVFLDIEMPDISGMELSKKILKIDENIAIVFTTAYSRYAVDAFRLDAMDYLLKPLDKTLLKETLDRIIQKKNIQVHMPRNLINCFGKFKVMNEGGKVKFRTAKAEELLAFFIDQYGREVSRSEIIDHIWSDFDGDKAVDNFNTTLYYMKKALMDNGFQIIVERNKSRYKLIMDSTYCDYYEFLSFIHSKNDINNTTIKKWEQVIELYRDDYLKGNDFLWSERNRISIKEKYTSLILKMFNYYSKLKQFEKADEILKIGLRYEPLHEVLNERLIKNYILMGDRYSAVKYFNLYKERIERELSMEPNSRIKIMIENIKK